MPQMPLNPGEIAINQAPAIDLTLQTSCIPQHFLTYAHSLESVEAIIADIGFCDRYPIFVSEDKGGIYIQIGVIGPDNYKVGPEKLVFGRRWRVEPNLPTSEIIQTVFLALKKAREHEIRECFVLRLNGQVTTPFNGHHDLPLMAQQAGHLTQQPSQMAPIEDLLACVTFDDCVFELREHLQTASGSHILTLSCCGDSAGSFATDMGQHLTLVTKSLDKNEVLYALMETLIAQSDRYVDETFQYRGFARFSRDVDVASISRIVAKTRQCPTRLIPDPKQAKRFLARLKKENYETDETRIPSISQSVYGQNLQARLSGLGLL